MNDLIERLEQIIKGASMADGPYLIGELERLKCIAWATLISHQVTRTVPVADGKYLTVDQVTDRFKVSRRWLYRHKKQIPHSQPSRKTLLFPESAVTKWFASRHLH